MAKKNKSVKKTDSKKKFLEFNLTDLQKYILLSVLILSVILIYFSQIIFQHKVSPATDSLTWQSNAHSIIEAREKYDYNPLWANNVFSGHPAQTISVISPIFKPISYFLGLVSKILSWTGLFFLIGGIGMLLLMRFWNFSYVISFFVSQAFMWWPYFFGLLEAGHNTKVRTIMMAPLVIYFFLRLIAKNSILNFVCFSILFGLFLRQVHYQIIYYVGILLCFLAYAGLKHMFKEKNWKGLIIKFGLILSALILAVCTNAYNMLLIKEYSKYSIRGTTGEKGSTGLTYDYATSWSLNPPELVNLLIPRFFGGSSSEVYRGNDVPQLKNRQIPGYWGSMPSTSSTDYLGPIIIILALIGVIYSWKNRWVRALLLAIFLSLLISFGRHFPFVYDLFFNYMPFFNKFRVPSMIFVLVQICTVILAGFGAEFLFQLSKEKLVDKTLLIRVSIVVGIVLAIGFVPFIFKNLFSFIRPDEITRYQADVIPMLKNARYDMMKQDSLRLILITSVLFIVIILYLKQIINKYIFSALLIILLFIDLFSINDRYFNNLVEKKNISQLYRKNSIDKFLDSDSSLYRIFPLGQLYGDYHFTYWHQSIGGYHPAKLRSYQDINEFCLYDGNDPGFQNNPRIPINWNIVNMLNAKYILAQGRIDHKNLILKYTDQDKKILVYENTECLGRAYVVGNVEVIKDRNQRLKRLNDPNFNPANQAIIEKDLAFKINTPTNWSAKITRYEPNYIDIDAKTDSSAMLVLSENYYPGGWKAYLDGERVEIYKTNHILRSIYLPSGTHKIEFKLEPTMHYAGMWLEGVSITLLYLLLLVAIILHFYHKGKIINQ